MKTSKIIDFLVICLVEIHLRSQYRWLVKIHKRCNGFTPKISKPFHYSELMLWRKAIDRNSIFPILADKLKAKNYIRDQCPGLRLPSTLWQGTDIKQIPSTCFKQDTWLKANHGSSYNLFCPAGKRDAKEMDKVARSWLKSIYGRKTGEWPYELVEPNLFLEESIRIKDTPLLEFQIRAGNGKVSISSIMGFGKSPEQWHLYLDSNGVPLTSPVVSETGEKTEHGFNLLEIQPPYQAAVEYAKVLSKNLDYLRCDFFWNGEQLYGSELTLFPNGGFNNFDIPEMNESIRSCWDLRSSGLLNQPQKGWRRWYAAALRRQWRPPQRQK